MNAAKKIVAAVAVAASLLGVAAVAQPASADDKVTTASNRWCC